MKLPKKKLAKTKLAETKLAKTRGRNGPKVTTTAGVVVGAAKAKGTMHRFQGVPYATPPVGDLRWQPPQALEPWTGERQCTKPGAMAFQRSQSIELFMAALASGLGLSKAKQTALVKATALPRKQDEDCLTLNVRAPAHATGLPVMVWIHGGDHTDGSSTEVFYNSDALPERGCVLVTINYRLGLFGFFAHPELSAESANDTSGNYGLLDQIAALEWVRDNIAGFGGDPNNVTIFGESAGGQAVLNLMTAPAAHGLFHRAISQSPSDSGRWLHLRQPMLDFLPAEEAGSGFADAVVGPGAGQLARLRALSAEELYERYRELPEWGRHFYPCVDRTVLPETPLTAFSGGRQAPVPLLIGSNADEGTLLAPFIHPAGAEFRLDDPTATVEPAEVRAALVRSYGSEDAADQILSAYPGLENSDAAACSDHTRDHMFGVHVEHATIEHASAGHPTFRYHFRAVPASPTQTAGAFHAAEITYVFGSSIPLVSEPVDAHLLTRTMGDRWFAFAATGSPEFPGLAEWPLFDEVERQQMVFDRPSSRVAPTERSRSLDLMRERVIRLNQRSADGAATIDLRPAEQTTSSH